LFLRKGLRVAGRLIQYVGYSLIEAFTAGLGGGGDSGVYRTGLKFSEILDIINPKSDPMLLT